MPFTLSHPVAAVPLRRYGLVLSALVIGSMTPDFPYFVCLSTRCQFGHTLLGLIGLDLPVGLGALWLFHRWLKFPGLSLLPLSHQRKLLLLAQRSFTFRPWSLFSRIVLSLLIGALSHIIWDAFTHRHGWGVIMFPVLNTPLLETTQGTLKIYKFLQYASSLLGGLWLLNAYFSWLRQTPDEMNYPSPLSALSTSMRLWVIVVLLGNAIIVIVLAGLYNLFMVPIFSWYVVMVKSVIMLIPILAMEWLIFSRWWYWRKNH